MYALVRVGVILSASSALACGARSDIDGNDLGGQSSDAGAGDSAQFADHSLCVSASGTRLCGGDPPCPEIPAHVCPGYGCQHSADIDSGAAARGGICLSDLPDQGRFPCFACNDGEACLTRPNGDLVCVPIDVCHALWDIGVRDVCRYADKTVYDDRPLDSSDPPCPDKTVGSFLCGGKCGGCGLSFPNARCSGRSATRRFGFCKGEENASVDAIRTCDAPRLTGPTVWCDPQYPATWVCGIYKNGSAVDDVSRKYAASCLGEAECKKLRPLMGIECFNRFGQLIP